MENFFVLIDRIVLSDTVSILEINFLNPRFDSLLCSLLDKFSVLIFFTIIYIVLDVTSPYLNDSLKVNWHLIINHRRELKIILMLKSIKHERVGSILNEINEVTIRGCSEIL